MSRLIATFVLGAAAISLPTVSCVGSSEEPTNSTDPNGREELGESRDALCTGTIVGNVVIQPRSYHWEDPVHLITSAEGCGPQSLGVSVSTAVSPTYSISSNIVPADSEISYALGYSLTESVVLTASSNMLVPTAAYGWLEAYPTFQVSTWDIIGVNCYGPGPTPIPQMVVGTGVAYKPIGVYFRAIRALDCSAIGGVIGPGPFPIVVPGNGTGGAGGAAASSSSAGGPGGAGGAGGSGGTGGAGGAGGSGGATGTNPYPIVLPTGAGSSTGSASSATGINPYPIVLPTSGSGAGGATGAGGGGGTGG